MSTFPEVEQEIFIGYPLQRLVFTGEWHEFPVRGHRRANRNKHRSMFVPVYVDEETGQRIMMMTMSVASKATQQESDG